MRLPFRPTEAPNGRLLYLGHFDSDVAEWRVYFVVTAGKYFGQFRAKRDRLDGARRIVTDEIFAPILEDLSRLCLLFDRRFSAIIKDTKI